MTQKPAAAPQRALPTALRMMGRITGPLPRADAAELLDLPRHDGGELADNLRDIRRLNRWFGGTATVTHALPMLLAAVPADRPVLVLDLATGSADIPQAIARWGSRHAHAFRVIASDVSGEIVSAARRQLAGDPAITLGRFDARAVPLPDRSVDIAVCSLALHHFPPDQAIAVLREMDRVSRVGFVLNDLARSRRGYLGAWLAAHLTTRNRLTRHDAPLSVRRAYTPAELAALLAQAGVRGATIARRPWFRMMAVKVMGDG